MCAAISPATNGEQRQPEQQCRALHHLDLGRAGQLQQRAEGLADARGWLERRAFGCKGHTAVLEHQQQQHGRCRRWAESSGDLDANRAGGIPHHAFKDGGAMHMVRCESRKLENHMHALGSLARNVA